MHRVAIVMSFVHSFVRSFFIIYIFFFILNIILFPFCDHNTGGPSWENFVVNRPFCLLISVKLNRRVKEG